MRIRKQQPPQTRLLNLFKEATKIGEGELWVGIFVNAEIFDLLKGDILRNPYSFPETFQGETKP